MSSFEHPKHLFKLMGKKIINLHFYAQKFASQEICAATYDLQQFDI